MAVKLAPESVALHVGNLRARLPLHDGIVRLTHFPLLHIESMARLEDGSFDFPEAST